jgi:Flavin-binding monooxygenase-like
MIAKMEYIQKYLIIGAGPGGISAGISLKKHHIAFDIIDKGAQIGGIWDINRPDTPMYESAHFISSKTQSGFSDFPMPDHFPDYPSHELVLEYIQAYAKKHDMEQYCEFGKSVTWATPTEDKKGWEVTFDNKEKRIYKGIIVAIGRQNFPNFPSYQGNFTGETMHAQDYRSMDVFKGKRVLIVGAGNSACDIACDAARVAKKSFISWRRGYYLMPKYLFGRPVDVTGDDLSFIPTWIERKLAKIMMGIFVGKMENFGLPKPDHDPLASNPIVNSALLEHLGHGDIFYRPDIQRFENKKVFFKDDSSEEIDLILYGTGYKDIYPFIDPAALQLTSQGIPDLYMNIVAKNTDNLFIINLIELDSGGYNVLAQQGALIAALLRHSAMNDSTVYNDFMKEKLLPLDLRGDATYIDSPRHYIYVKAKLYKKHLKNMIARLEA